MQDDSRTRSKFASVWRSGVRGVDRACVRHLLVLRAAGPRVLSRFLDVALASDVVDERERSLGDFFRALAWHDNDPAPVGHDHIARPHENSTYRHGPVHGLQFVASRPDAARKATEI